jgi:GT2 family glycosyltransferase
MTVDVTVAIPTYRRPESLARTLDSLVDAIDDELAVELLVVDQSDGPVEEHAGARKRLGDRYRHFQVDPPSLTAARNFALGQATGPVIVFLDDDVLVDPGLLHGFRDAFADPRVGAVAGRVVTPGAGPSDGLYRLLPYGADRGGLDVDTAGPAYTVQGCNMALRTAAVRQVGGFDTVYAGNALREETDLCRRLHRAGWALWYTPEARVTHLHAPDGGCRGDRPLAEQPQLYHNEVVFFLRQRRPLWVAPFLGYLLVHYVLDPEAVRGGRAPHRGAAYLRGVARGFRNAWRPPPRTEARVRG